MIFYEINIPPAIVGIIVLLVALFAFNCVPKPIAAASSPLLRHMSLFFIPAIVAIVNFVDIIQAFPLALLLAIIVCTLLSLVFTALLAQKLMAHMVINETK